VTAASFLPFADAVVVAAGSSRRMDGVDKLSADLFGRPLLRWSVEAMASARSVARLIVVAAPDRVEALEQTPWLRALEARVVPGGERRQDSVEAGVRAAESAVVLVHDGARPLATPELADAVAAAALEHGAAIPVLPVVDALKRVEGNTIVGVAARDGLGRAQTPQGARRELLTGAIEALGGNGESYGDEAELLARYGVSVISVPGEAANLKVTTLADLALARALAGGRAAAHRYGTGADTHPFGPDDGLRLCGIEIPEAPRLHGHSDGDAALHAVCNALLAASGQGDLGRLFPAGDPETRGIDSRALVSAVVGRLRDAGWRPASADLTIVGARPRLGGARLDRMRLALADLLALDPASVSVTAATGNLSGDAGAGRVISASAFVGVVAA
jgi:2-C-methyl-D-erythritol 4-phosphate cytidylyltransferase / 2-C-methyl-D-erythritol 2,4-cyclodiphosphate synthase